MYCDDELNQTWLQAEFLAFVNEVQPEACKALYAEPFRSYSELDLRCQNLTWEELKFRLDKPEIKALYDSIGGWANDWKLTAEWCKAAAYFTLQVWTDSSKPGEFFWHPGTTRIQMRYPPPDGLPLYKPEFGRELYLKEVEKSVREAIVNHPLLKFGKGKNRMSFIESIRDSAAVKKYCESVEKASKPLTVKKRRKVSQHLKWAAKVHVRGDKLLDVVKETARDDDRSVSEPAISMAVNSILKDLQL